MTLAALAHLVAFAAGAALCALLLFGAAGIRTGRPALTRLPRHGGRR
ncbi:hypothetical protein GGQ63_004124 [Prosthecomicrobium pneumaticum]|uniref:Uncharacterized protein n=1 Tax=Prosthecomicrobium pneumaticum TaxID=81895 RepID=A0A7W9FQQ3_9HYPH|nr:hypothetical protein [Prosthecomicrobium pneumaticum]